jgi:hypothetical protein
VRVFGASWGEWSFVAIMVVIVLVAQIAPRLGEVIGARLGSSRPPDPDKPGRQSTPRG